MFMIRSVLTSPKLSRLRSLVNFDSYCKIKKSTQFYVKSKTTLVIAWTITIGFILVICTLTDNLQSYTVWQKEIVNAIVIQSTLNNMASGLV